MKGLGFYIWQLANMPPVGELIAILKNYGVRWVCIKVQDGIGRYNQIGGNDKILRDEYIKPLQEAGIEVGGWGWIFPKDIYSPGVQAAVTAERIEKLGLTFWFVDAEELAVPYTPWKSSVYNKESANIYMNQLDINMKFPVMLSSYRFPKLHAPFPFKQFLNHEHSHGVAPQMYWLEDTRPEGPRLQLERCISEHNEIINGGIDKDYPMIPIGCAFDHGKWSPTTLQIADFVQAAKDLGCSAWGFWSLDWVLAKKRYDWLDAMRGIISDDPPEEPPDDPPVEPSIEIAEAIVNLPIGWHLNLRSTPSGINLENVVGRLQSGRGVYIYEVTAVGDDTWARVGPDVWAAFRYRNKEYLTVI